MKRYISLLMGLLAFIPMSAQQSDYYYYYKGNRIDLKVDSTRLYVVSEGALRVKTAASAKIRMADYKISTPTKSYVYNHVVTLQQRRSVAPDVYFSTLEVPKGLSTTQYKALLERVKSENNVWRQAHYEDADHYFENTNVDVKNVTANDNDEFHIFKDKNVILRSSVRIKEGAELLIWQRLSK